MEVINIPETQRERIVIIGGGFAGIEVAQALSNHPAYQVVLLDKNNFHQFQPLFYQVATAGLEPSSIIFPLRKLFHGADNVHVRVTSVNSIDRQNKVVYTSLGPLKYDKLIIAAGADTNYFGNKTIQELAFPMKSVQEALTLRNRLLINYEKAIAENDFLKRQALMSVVVVGGGPTGVELAGAIAEMRKYVLPKDLPELDFGLMQITLVEASPRVLNGMSHKSDQNTQEFLRKLGVNVLTGAAVKEYNGESVILSDGTELLTNTLIWAAGVRANFIEGLPQTSINPQGRILVGPHLEVKDAPDVFALGDIAAAYSEGYPKGHPQVASVAQQMGRYLGEYLKAKQKNKIFPPFTYNDKGSMATIGRNKAVVDMGKFHLKGLLAWLVWMGLHLLLLLGVKNRVIVFVNWAWAYLRFDQSLRLILWSPTDKIVSAEPVLQEEAKAEKIQLEKVSG